VFLRNDHLLPLRSFQLSSFQASSYLLTFLPSVASSSQLSASKSQLRVSKLVAGSWLLTLSASGAPSFGVRPLHLKRRVRLTPPAGNSRTARAVDGPVALRHAALKRQEEFVRTMTKSLLTYGLGRRARYYDMRVVRAICSRTPPVRTTGSRTRDGHRSRARRFR